MSPVANIAQDATANEGDAQAVFTAGDLCRLSGAQSETTVRNEQRRAGGEPQPTIRHNRLAQGWTYQSLSPKLRAVVSKQARQQNVRSLSDLCSLQPWQPPFDRVDPRQLVHAEKLKRAMANTVLRIQDPALRHLPKTELARLGMPEFKAVFGYEITARRWLEIIDRVIERDRGFNQFHRVHLYLAKDDTIRPALPQEAEAARASSGEFPLLDDFIETVASPNDLSRDDIDVFWSLVLETYHHFPAKDSAERKAFKRRLIAHVWRILPNPGRLPASPKAFDKQLRRDYPAWVANGAKAIQSEHKGRPRGPDLSDETLGLIIWHIVHNRGGRIAQGWGEFMGERITDGHGQIIHPPQEFLDYYKPDAQGKYHCPPKIYARLAPEVRTLYAVEHGPKAHSDQAHLYCDNSNIPSGAVWSSDDLTAPVYYRGDNGRDVLRGQVLVTADRRSRKILGVACIPEATYNSIEIRNHWGAIAEMFQFLPRIFEVERGVWLNSRLIKGDARSADAIDPALAEKGLTQFARFRHRTRAQGKVVENILGLFQNLMEGEPGYCGRNERTDRFERFQKLKLDIERGAVSADGKLYTFNQWNQRLIELAVKYNQTPQHGELAGLAPDEAWEKFWPYQDPPAQLTDEMKFAFATHERVVTVNGNGASFKLGDKEYCYRNEQTGRLIGHQVRLRFDPRDTSIAYISTMDNQQIFASERAMPLDPVNAHVDDLAEEKRKVNAHLAPVKARYHALRSAFAPVFRPAVLDQQPRIDLAAAHASAEEIKHKRAERSRKQAAVRRNAQNLGVTVPANPHNLDRVLEGQKREAEIRARIAARGQKNTDAATKQS